jgi:TetR/AcrR family transcriptional regulator, regulator of autoinduction and epiphytic fitness
MPTRQKSLTTSSAAARGKAPLKAAARTPQTLSAPEDHTAARRVQILDAALEALQTRGFRDTTMLDVATAARASKNTLYQHFPNKVALFEALAARATGDGQVDLAGALDGSSPLEAALQRFGEAWLRTATGSASLAVQRAAIGEAMTAPELGLALARGGDAARPAVLKYLRDRTRDGQLQKVEPADALDTLIGLLVGGSSLAWLSGSSAAPTDAERRRRARAAARRFVQLFGA